MTNEDLKDQITECDKEQMGILFGRVIETNEIFRQLTEDERRRQENE